MLGDVAISSAKFILVSSNLYTLLTLTDLSRKVFTRIKFNFVCYLELCCILSHSLFSLGSSFGQLCTILLLYQLLQESFSLLGMYVSAPCGHHWQWLCRMWNCSSLGALLLKVVLFSRSTSVVCSSLLLKLYKEPRAESWWFTYPNAIFHADFILTESITMFTKKRRGTLGFCCFVSHCFVAHFNVLTWCVLWYIGKLWSGRVLLHLRQWYMQSLSLPTPLYAAIQANVSGAQDYP